MAIIKALRKAIKRVADAAEKHPVSVLMGLVPNGSHGREAAGDRPGDQYPLPTQNRHRFDALAYIAFALAPLTRQQRADASQPFTSARCQPKRQASLNFVLAHYVKEGVGELDRTNLPRLLELKYQAINDAAVALGGVASIRDAFIGIQRSQYG